MFSFLYRVPLSSCVITFYFSSIDNILLLLAILVFIFSIFIPGRPFCVVFPAIRMLNIPVPSDSVFNYRHMSLPSKHLCRFPRGMRRMIIVLLKKENERKEKRRKEKRTNFWLSRTLRAARMRSSLHPALLKMLDLSSKAAQSSKPVCSTELKLRSNST